MKIQKIGKRGLLFSFPELGIPTNVYVINGKEHIFICDTYLGSHPMKTVEEYIRSKFGKKPLAIFNSHFHWDHIWGNCYFKSSLIFSQEKCRDNILTKAEDEFNNEFFQKYKMGSVEIVYPKLTFKERLIFHDEGLIFFHTPGHSDGSASCLDKEDNVLFVGDNLEEPLPYFANEDLESYLSTLEKYSKMNVNAIITGHTDIADKSLLEANIKYVKSFISRDTKEYEENEEYKKIHLTNMKTLGLLDDE